MKYLALAVLFLSLYAAPLFSNERTFSYVYETATLPPGAKELEVWNTFRLGRLEHYEALDQRIELELGVADDVMTAFYLNSRQENGVYKSRGFSNEWKFKVSDPVADEVGFALYGEAGFQAHEIELEQKLLLDKRLEEWLGAFNAVAEQEFKYRQADEEIVLLKKKYSLIAGLSRTLSRKVSLGVEARYTTILEGRASNAFHAGPSLAASFKDAWFVLTVLPQWGETKDLLVFEKSETRLLFALHL